MTKREKITRKIFPVLSWTLLFIWCAFLLYMLFWALMTSLKGNLDFLASPVGFPKKLMFSNYSTAIRNIATQINTRDGGTRMVGFLEMLRNSLLYAIGAPFFAVLTAAMSSYVVCKYSKQFKWLAWIFAIVIFTTYVPLSASLASNIKLMKDLHLYDNMIGMYIYSSGAFGTMFLIYYATFKGVSWAYAEAAFIDGASHFRVFVQLMLPLTKTVFGALFITSFIGIWNDYMTPMIYLPSYPTLAYGAWQVQYSTITEFSMVPVQLAGLMIIILPIFVLFMVFKEKLMGALTMGGLKG